MKHYPEIAQAIRMAAIEWSTPFSGLYIEIGIVRQFLFYEEAFSAAFYDDATQNQRNTSGVFMLFVAEALC